MIKLKEVEIVNYRSCFKTKLELHDNLTTLIGINGVGKSNIMNSLQLLKQCLKSRRHYRDDSVDLQNTRLDLRIQLEDSIVILRSDIYYETDERNFDYVNFARIQFRYDGGNPRKWTKIHLGFYDYIRRPSENNRLIKKKYQTKRARTSFQILQLISNISYYSATQFADPTRCPISIELEDFRLSRRYRGNRFHEIFIFDLYRTFILNQKTFELFLNTVNQNGIQLIDDFNFNVHKIPSSSYKVKSGGQIEKIEKHKKIIIPSVVVDGLTLSPNQLSEGTFKSLALAFYILIDDSKLLLIEEPEVCVHHGLLDSIIELIKSQSRRKQIIISTHSDYVLDKLSPENIILVNKNKSKGTKAKKLTKAMSINDFQALKEYLGKSGNLGEYWIESGFEDE